MTDKEIIKQIQSGRKELLHDVIERYYDDILRFCIYQLRDVSYAYDLTQETFYRFIRCVDTYQYKNLKAYLVQIARNLCVDYWHDKTDMIDIEYQEIKVQDDRRPLEQIENEMVLTELLAKLPLEQREVIIMRYYSDLKLTDIAGILNVNLSTIKSRLRLGLKALKKIADNS